jgi:hypothetical protein
VILAFALLLLAMPQEPEAQAKQQPTPEEVQQWWDGLSKEEREVYRGRQKRFRQLDPTMQEELGRRHDLLHEERKRVRENLSEEEKVQFEAMKGYERRHFLDMRAHENLRQRGERLAQQFPGADAVRDQAGFERRHQKAAKLFEQERGPEVREAIRQAVAEGWIGEIAGQWLETAPLEEAMSALMEVRKWRFLQKASEKGLWQEMGFDEQRRRETVTLPAQEFFRAIRGHREGRRGRRGGAHEFGPPGEQPEDMRGNLRGGPGPRPGDGLGPKHGDRRGPGPGGKLGPPRGEDAGFGRRPGAPPESGAVSLDPPKGG